MHTSDAFIIRMHVFVTNMPVTGVLIEYFHRKVFASTNLVPGFSFPKKNIRIVLHFPLCIHALIVSFFHPITH